MNMNTRWQQDLISALRSESSFTSAGFAFPKVEWAESIKPTHAESSHAVANIQEWRSYLPEACVTSMIDDGWQWST